MSDATNTPENALYINELLERANLRGSLQNLTLVTNDYHALRAALTFKKVFGENVSIAVQRVEDRGEDDIKKLTSELASIIVYSQQGDLSPVDLIDLVGEEKAKEIVDCLAPDPDAVRESIDTNFRRGERQREKHAEQRKKYLATVKDPNRGYSYPIEPPLVKSVFTPQSSEIPIDPSQQAFEDLSSINKSKVTLAANIAKMIRDTRRKVFNANYFPQRGVLTTLKRLGNSLRIHFLTKDTDKDRDSNNDSKRL